MALNDADAAIAADFQEASFHGLRGDVSLAQKKYADAITNYDRAIARDDGFFAYYLGRGLAKHQLKRAAGARTDLERSVALLPTSTAYNALGGIAEGEGKVDAALGYYGAAAQSETPAGQAARRRYVALDIGRRPAEYVKTDVVSLDAGPGLAVANAAGVDLVNVAVVVRLRWADDAERRFTRRVAHLPAGQRVLIQLPVRSGIALTAAQAQAVSAAVEP